jgi:hypothetical protein
MKGHTGHFCLSSTPSPKTKFTPLERSLKILQPVYVSSRAQVSNPLANGSISLGDPLRSRRCIAGGSRKSGDSAGGLTDFSPRH